MRVLLIAYTYPPAEASGAQRVGNVAAALQSAGMHVRVVSASETRVPRSSDSPSLEVERVRALPDGTNVLRWLARLKPRRRSQDAAPAPSIPDPREDGPTFRRWAFSSLRFLGGDMGFVVPALWAALRRDGPPPDVVYTSGPPMSAHLVGLLVHAMIGCPWVIEFRDPWMVDDDPYRPRSLRSAVTDAVERGLYRRCLAAAAEVVAVSRGIAEEIAGVRARAGGSEPRIIRNGIPVLAAKPEPRRDGPLRVLHLGTLYAFRDPAPFLDALTAWREKLGPGRPELEVRFVGSPPDAQVLEQIADLGLADIVRFDAWVDHAAGQQLVADADLLLLFAQGQPLQVPNKLYEYLGSRKPILAFADEAGETAHLLRESGSGILVTERDSPERVREIVSEALSRAGSLPAAPDPRIEARLEGWTTAAQLSRIPDVVRRAAGHS